MTDETPTWNEAASIHRGADGSLVVRTARGQRLLDGDATVDLLRAIRPGEKVPEEWIEEVEDTGLALPPAPPLARYLGARPPGAVVATGAGAAVRAAEAVLESAGALLRDGTPDLALALAFEGSPAPIAAAIERWSGSADVLPAELVGTVLRLGPVAEPGHACWACAEARVLNNATVPDAATLTRTEPVQRPVVPEELVRVGASLAALAARTRLVDGTYLRDVQVSFDLASLARDAAPVVAVPGCAACREIRAGKSRAPRSRAPRHPAP